MPIYAFRYRQDTPQYQMLVELDDRQFAALASADWRGDDAYVYDTVDYGRAHKWVRDGGPHETLLWVDNGRIRRA